MKRQKNGLYSYVDVKKSNLPLFSFDTYVPIDMWTYTDLKKIFNIKLNDSERDDLIRGFIKMSKHAAGYTALYSFVEIHNLRFGTDFSFEPRENYDDFI